MVVERGTAIAIRIIVVLSLLTTGLSLAGTATNTWIKGSSGAWEETSSWSLGQLPNSSQSIEIDGSWLAVAINPSTAQSYPDSLTVSNIVLNGSNTVLLLNYFGNNPPLTALNGLTVDGQDPTNSATLMCLDSGLTVQSGPFWVTGNGKVLEDGGMIMATNGPTYLNGRFDLSNGVFEATSVQFGLSPSGYSSHVALFYQYGGSVNLGDVTIGSVSPGNTYTMYGGQLNASGFVYVGGVDDAAHFLQYGGTVQTGRLLMGSDSGGNTYTLEQGQLIVTGTLTMAASPNYSLGDTFVQDGGTNCLGELSMAPDGGNPKYILNAGLLCASNVTLEYSSAFQQNGGTHVVTNTLSLLGWGDYHLYESSYNLTNGVLSAGNLQIQASVFHQTNSMTLISGTLELGGANFAVSGSLILDSGTLACSNVSYAAAGCDIFQNGGQFVVSNTLSFGGFENWYGRPIAQYFFYGGSLAASNIELSAQMNIGSTAQAGRITNPGYFKMAGTLEVGDAIEQLGEFILASNAVIDLGGGNADLGFADSSAQSWNSAAILVLTNWGGSTNGGGNDQVRFGTSASALTANQLSQIRFLNPAGFASGTYAAQILETGEVVPMQRPTISFSRIGADLVLNWPGGFTLQTATNVGGPYQNVPASPPYTNDTSATPQCYFRLRQ